MKIRIEMWCRRITFAFASSVWLSGLPVLGASLLVPPASDSHLPAAGECSEPTISADGRFILFASEAGNLVPADANGARDFYLRDRETGVTRLVSRAAGGGASAGGVSQAADMTPDARYIVFQSTATNLVAAGLPSAGSGRRSLIYRWDRETDEMRAINVQRPVIEGHPFATNALTNLSRDLILPQTSPDGHRVLFEVGGGRDPELMDTNLVEPELGAVFLWDAIAGTTELLSGHFQVQPPETNNVFTLYSSSRLPVAHRMSDDGRFVALTLSARAPQAGTNVGLHGPLTTLVVRDRVNGTNGLPGYAFNQFGQFHVRDSPRQRSSRAIFSADGRRLLFETRVADLGNGAYSAGSVQLWWQDLESGEAVMVSTNEVSGQVGSPGSGAGAISGDGRWIAYLSLATNLVEQDVDGRLDVYLHDCEQRTTDRISTHAAWQPSDLRQFEDAPILTPDGRFILYQAIGSGLFRHDRVTGTNALITTDVGTDRADISDDGRFVVFTARPASLDPADPNPHRNIYCHDFETGLTELVSVRDPSVPPGTPDGPTALELGAVSADGRFVAFTSQARTLDPRANGSQQLWLRDLQTGTSTLISRDRTGQPLVTDERFRNVQLSPDGRWLSFVSRNGGLLYGDTNQVDDVFLFDRQTGFTRYVSYNLDGTAAAAGRSYDAVMNREGTFLVFNSTATNLVTGGSRHDLYLHDIAANENRLVTTNFAGPGGVSGDCSLARLSDDGRWLLFLSVATNLVADAPPSHVPQPYLKNLVSGATTFVGGSDPADPVLPNGVARTQLGPTGSHLLLAGGSYFGISGPTWLHDVAAGTYQALTGHVTRGAFSTDGRWLAYHRPATEGGVFHQLYLRELDSAAETLVSYTYGQSTPANDHSRVIGFSRDDRYLLFSSHASDLTPNDGNAAADVFLHDRQTGSNLLVSRSGNGSANGFTGQAVLTADGGKIFFESHASDLTAHDHNEERDIFVLTLQQLQDHDNDGLPDEWELAYFNDLDEDGGGDADGDGLSDADEFRAGTIPTISTSVLRVVTLTSIGSGATTVLWQAVPGQSHRVEYRNSFSGGGWEPAGGIVTADSSLGTFEHVAPPAGERYYRVMVEE